MAVTKRFWMIWVVLVLVGMACASCAILPPAKAVESGEILFQDGFSGQDKSWTTWDQDASAVAYYEGGLRIRIDQANTDFWSRPGERFADVRIEVDVARLVGPDNNNFGIICRYRNGENFYRFVVSSDGYSGIARVQDGAYSLLSGDTLQYSPAVRQGDGINHLRADCTGQTLSLWVNDEPVAQAQDTSFASGEVGLIAGSYDTPGVDIFFDNFIVIKP